MRHAAALTLLALLAPDAPASGHAPYADPAARRGGAVVALPNPLAVFVYSPPVVRLAAAPPGSFAHVVGYQMPPVAPTPEVSYLLPAAGPVPVWSYGQAEYPPPAAALFSHHPRGAR